MRITGSIAFAADISRLQWIAMIIDSYILCLRIFANISSTASSSIWMDDLLPEAFPTGNRFKDIRNNIHSWKQVEAQNHGNVSAGQGRR